MRKACWLVLLFSACRGAAPADAGVPFVCTTVEWAACPDPDGGGGAEPVPTYGDVKPVLDARCANCHVSGDPTGPWPLTTYQDVASWSEVIRSQIETCEMPPVNDGGVPLTDAEKRLLLRWLACGSPQ